MKWTQDFTKERNWRLLTDNGKDINAVLFQEAMAQLQKVRQQIKEDNEEHY